MITEVEVMKGWILPFFPMRPANGPKLTKKLALEILEKMDEHRYIYQPKLNGDRVILAIHQRRVLAASRHYDWYSFQIANAGDFKAKLGDGTVLDGEVYKGNFYPFECLALEGRSFKQNTTEEREIMAMQMCRLCKVQWMYKKPTKKWLLNPSLPQFEGVVRKRADFPYVLLSNATGISSGWIKHRW